MEGLSGFGGRKPRGKGLAKNRMVGVGTRTRTSEDEETTVTDGRAAGVCACDLVQLHSDCALLKVSHCQVPIRFRRFPWGCQASPGGLVPSHVACPMGRGRPLAEFLRTNEVSRDRWDSEVRPSSRSVSKRLLASREIPECSEVK